MLPYEKFEAWHRCHELVLAVYRATARWPRTELYGLTSQARRAAVSAPANLAEGSAKRGIPEFRRYLNISLGSLLELAYLLRLSRDLGLLSQDEWTELDGLRNRAGQLTWRLYESLGKAARR
jgi:four helix bundle protein